MQGFLTSMFGLQVHGGNGFLSRRSGHQCAVRECLDQSREEGEGAVRAGNIVISQELHFSKPHAVSTDITSPDNDSIRRMRVESLLLCLSGTIPESAICSHKPSMNGRLGETKLSSGLRPAFEISMEKPSEEGPSIYTGLCPRPVCNRQQAAVL